MNGLRLQADRFMWHVLSNLVPSNAVILYEKLEARPLSCPRVLAISRISLV